MPDEADAQRAVSGADGDATPSDHTVPTSSMIPTPEAICDATDPTGVVVWHRKHLRVDDHLALSQAIADGDVVCPLFVFDPAFYADGGLACDARIRLLEEALTSLDRLYAARSGELLPTDSSGVPFEPETDQPPPDTLRRSDSPGMTFGYGDPVELVARFVERGWAVVTMATPTSRYGKRRDERVQDVCGDAVTFVSGDGLIRGEAWPRSDWQPRITEWLDAPQHAPRWDTHDTRRVMIETGVTPAVVDRHFDITPTKTQVPTGTHRAANAAIRAFTDRIRSYPSAISAPQDARGGTSGLSPYLNFGLLSVRQAYQYVSEHAPSCRGSELFESRLVWNLHYNQKLVDWPGWTERAVNPAFAGRNEPHRDDDLVTAWKRGQTGFPMVDASMRCLRQTGWLNFRMRAMCASMFTHVLHQPWWIGAEWYHHHLIDSDVGINYTQWQSQAGLVGRPSKRVYNPRKQVHDQDPDGEWITQWVPELADLPSQFLDQPEKTPIAVQQECGVHVGETYPRPVVDFEARREQFWTRYNDRRAAAARELRRPEIAKRASFAGGYAAARAIADDHETTAATEAVGTQIALDEVTTGTATETPDERRSETTNAASTESPVAVPPETDRQPTLPSGAGHQSGEPSPDDRAAVAGQPLDGDSEDGDTSDPADTTDTSDPADTGDGRGSCDDDLSDATAVTGQTRFRDFE